MMKYYPILLDVKDRKCLVVGGGIVGARKVWGLIRAGARVKVVSRTFSDLLSQRPHPLVSLEKKDYSQNDIKQIFMVFATTNNAALNQRILADARKNNVLVSLADAPEDGDFIIPSVTTRGDLICTVSTSGTSPALSKKIRKEMDRRYGAEYETFLILMKNIRKKLLSSRHDPHQHKIIFTSLVESQLPALIESGNIQKIDDILENILGKGNTYDCLMSQ